MSTGYTRNDTSNNIAEGNVIRASDLDGEFDAVQTAFNSSSGHTHDGTSGEGGPITKLGPSQNVTVSASLLGPTSADDTIDLGTSSVQYKDLYIDGTAYIDGLGEDLLVATTAAVQFRDTDLSINSSTDGQLDIDADTELELTSPIVDINASTSVNISNDLKLDSDSAVLSLGADDDVTITHIPDTAVRVNDAIGVQFRDAALSINSSTDGQLDIDADAELEITAPIVDINASTSVNISNDLKLDSDAAVLSMGADGEVVVTHVHDTGLEVKATNSTTNSTTDVVDVRVETSGSAAAGIGAGIGFTAETGSTNFEKIAAIRAVTSDVTAGQEDADLAFHVMQAGTLSEAFRYDAIDDELYVSGDLETTGAVKVGGVLTLGSTAISSTAAELNITDGDTSATSTTLADADQIIVNDSGTMVQTTLTDLKTYMGSSLDTLNGLTATVTELNVMDAGTSATSTTLADADRVVINDDDDVMKQVALTDFGTYFKTGRLDVTALGTVEASKAVTANSSGEVIVPDNKRILFGSDSDVGIQYDESTDDRLEISGGEVYVDNTLRAKRGIGATHTFTTSGANVTLDFATYQNFVVTLGHVITLVNPTTEAVGQSGFIVFIQDGSGSRTVSLGTEYKTAGGANSLDLSTAASSVDVVPYLVSAAGSIILGATQKAFS